MVGVGMSLGANMIMRNAADMPDFPLRALVAVNNPFDIWLATNLMRGKVYEKHLTNELKRSLILREPQSEKEKLIFQQMVSKFDLNMEAIKKAETWRDFDEEFTRKVHYKWPCCA